MSSPQPQESGSPSFERLLTQGLDPMHTFGASSPIQSTFHSTFDYDPTAASPYTALGKTPTARLRNRSADAYLVSPLAAGSQSSFAAKIRTGGHLHGNTLFKRPAEEEVTVVEPTNTWEEGNLEVPGSGMDFDAFSHHSPYTSLMKARSIAATPVNMTLPDLTPTNSPRILSAPSTIQRRTQRAVTGLGSPSVHRSGGARNRQATYDAAGIPISPSIQRRRVDSSTSLTTSVPLVRNVSSSSFLGPPQYSQDRVVSNASMMTASTSYEVMSPHLTAFPHSDYPMITSQSLPELVGSQHPSPQLSGARSPVQTPQQPAAVFYTSPEADQGQFSDGQHQHDMSLMSGVSHIMGGGQGSVPNSAHMGYVPQFGHDSNNRQQTLSTIVETPALIQDGQLSYTNIMPPQPSMQSHQFDTSIHYPPVPGMQSQQQQQQQQQQSFALPTTSQPVDIQAWSAQTYNVGMSMGVNPNMPMYGFTSQAPMQRHASASYIYAHPQPQHQHHQHQHQQQQQPQSQREMSHLSAPPMASRSVSAPFITMSSMPSMSTMPMSMSAGGLFGPGPSHSHSDESIPKLESFEGHPPLPPYHRVNSAPVSATASPETPRKRKTYPRIGNPLRPGPKPKPKTPKKGARGSSASGASSPEYGGGGGGVDPSLFAGPSLSRIDETFNEQPAITSVSMLKPPSPPPAKSQTLTFGPDLHTVAMQRQLSGNSMGGGPMQGGSGSHQPQLVIQPPRQNSSMDGGLSGLPRSFLEKLYTTFLTLDGSVTGQPVKRFKCLIEGCERHFPRKSAIHSHIQTHLEDKPFICSAEDCGAAFVRQHDLRRHMRIHSGTKPFPCPCGKGFARGDALHRHRQRGICSGSIVPRRSSRSPPRYDPY